MELWLMAPGLGPFDRPWLWELDSGWCGKPRALPYSARPCLLDSMKPRPSGGIR